MIRLYALPISSYSAKVRICLRGKELAYEEVAPPGGYGSDDYAALVPVSTIPALDHDGFTIWDSEAIVEYLEDAFPHPPMLPADPQHRAFARTLSRFHDTRLEPNIRALFPQVAPQTRDPDKVASGVAMIETRLQQLSAVLDRAPFVPGETLMLCDCGFAISFVLLERLGAAIGFDVPIVGSIAAYRDRLARQSAVAEVTETYEQAIADWARARGV